MKGTKRIMDIEKELKDSALRGKEVKKWKGNKREKGEKDGQPRRYKEKQWVEEGDEKGTELSDRKG